MGDELGAYGKRLQSLTDPPALHRVQTAAGMAVKESTLDVAAQDLGGDRVFSGWRKPIRLGAGFDAELGSSRLTLNLRPVGLWILADKGRQRTGTVYPRTDSDRKGKKAVKGKALLTPMGFRSTTTFAPSRGLGTIGTAQDAAGPAAMSAAGRAITVELARVVRRS